MQVCCTSSQFHTKYGTCFHVYHKTIGQLKSEQLILSLKLFLYIQHFFTSVINSIPSEKKNWGKGYMHDPSSMFFRILDWACNRERNLETIFERCFATFYLVWTNHTWAHRPDRGLTWEQENKGDFYCDFFFMIYILLITKLTWKSENKHSFEVGNYKIRLILSLTIISLITVKILIYILCLKSW